MLRGVRLLVEYSVSLLKIGAVLMGALFLPQLYLRYGKSTGNDPVAQYQAAQFRLGLENLSDKRLFWNETSVQGEKSAIALITNQTGLDQEGNRNIDILSHKGLVIKKVLVPQGSNYPSHTRDTLKVPVITLQHKDTQELFTKKMVEDVSVLVFDMQDSGVRHYGYVSILLKAMQAAGMYHKKFVVLDRPNLLGGTMEGAFNGNLSVKDQVQVPLRHGMTIGELATYFNKYVLKKPIDLHVVPMEYYDRNIQVRTPLPTRLSRNIASLDACYGYSFLGLLGEVAPFEIGVGTDKAFQCLLLPDRLAFSKKKWQELKDLLSKEGIESKFYRYYSARKIERFSGLRLHVHDINHL